MQSVKRPAARALRLLLPPLQRLVPAARIVSKPGREKLTATDQIVAFAVITATLLLPSSWVISHLEPHRRRKRKGQ
ncbi:cytochrome c oxidase subunit 8B, mitochondrial [Mobula hypostoma]|uniref:cytochrome c oxidase subunit 8B, mitochondrial n=1 Tax=Mobula hypostoma TaxID=723540 RepID=UPI002FC356A8